MHRARRRTFRFVIALLSVATVARAEPSDDKPPAPTETGDTPAPMNAAAKERYDKGLALYSQREFRAAIDAFEEGFAIEPRREFLFAEAQAYRLAGDCAHAVPLFDRFLATQPSQIQIDATRLALDRCAHQAAPEAPRPVAPAPPKPYVPILFLPPPPWWRDPWGVATLATGLATAAVGGGFLLASERSWDAAHAPTVHVSTDFDRLIAQYQQRHTVGIVTLAAGGALCAAAIVRFAYVRHRNATADERTQAQLALQPLPGGGALSWRSDF